MDEIGRRGFVGVVGAGALVLGTTAAAADAPRGESDPGLPPGVHPDAADGVTAVHADNPRAPGASVAALLASVPVGTQLGPLRVVGRFDVFAGGVPMLLQDASGRHVQLDVLRSVPSQPAPLAEASGFAVYVCDGGDGHAPAHPDVVAAARHLVLALGPMPQGLMDFQTRASRHRGDTLSVQGNPLQPAITDAED